MLKLTDETREYLRLEQKRAETRERTRRLLLQPAPPIRTLNEDRFKRMAASVATILKAGRSSQFEYEGACRQGVRVSLVFEGWRWKDADATASALVSVALHMIGAERPSWDEGQLNFTNTHQVDHHFCARCGRVIGQDRKRFSTAKYCSITCGQAAANAKFRITGVRVARAAWLASAALKKERTILERSGNCEACGRPFITDRPNQRFCSMRCSGHEKIEIKPRSCIRCATMFTPSTNREQPYCSHACAMKGIRKERPELTCLHCKAIFRPLYPSQKRLYCSTACGRTARHRQVSSFRCETPD